MTGASSASSDADGLNIEDPSDRIHDGLAAFQRLYGHAPEGAWASPGRVNLIGEYTDFNDGFVLPFAISMSAHAFIARRHDRLVRVYSAQQRDVTPTVVEEVLDDLDPARANGWSAYLFGVFWALDRAGLPLTGCDVYLDSDVAIGAGLSSSAAIECAVGLGLTELFTTGYERAEIARFAQCAENDYVGVPTGIMDQTASLLAQPGYLLLLDTRTLDTRQVRLDLTGHELTLIIVDTGVKHALGQSAYAQRRKQCEEAAGILGVAALRDVAFEEMDAALKRIGDNRLRARARHVISENNRVLEVVARLEAGKVPEIGPLLSDSHRSLRDDFEVSSAELDTAVDAALTAGALGARLTGAGFGGAAIVLLARSRLAGLIAAVSSAFADRGFAAPHFAEVAPSPGARRIR